MRPRLVILPVAGLAIAALCAWRISRSDQPVWTSPGAEVRQPVPQPLFELHTHHSPPETLRLRAYIGRHTILVVFYDGAAGADQSPVLMRLKREGDRLKSAGIIVLAISDALPVANRAAMQRAGGFPFPLLTDLTMQVHEQWGRLDAATSEPVPGVFLIDRAGNVAWEGRHPRPVSNPEALMDELLND